MSFDRCVIFGAVPFVPAGASLASEELSYLRSELHPDDLILCADGGLSSALALGLTPHQWIGDGDSLSTQIPEGIAQDRLPCDKDVTDTQACLTYALDQGVRSFVFLGCLGGVRPDHFLANIALLELCLNWGAEARLVDADSELFLLREEKRVIPKADAFRYLSLIPLDREVYVTTEGLRFPLYGETLTRADTRGVSNVPATGDTVIVDVQGTALVVLTGRVSP